MKTKSGYHIGWSDQFATNVGGAGGPKVVSASFQIGGSYRDKMVLTASADLDRSLYQDSAAVRRRVARAVVPFGREIAKRLAAGAIGFIAERHPPANPFVRWAFVATTEYEGFERRVAGAVERHVEFEDGIPEVRRADIERLAMLLREMSDALHVAVDDPAHWEIFGGAPQKGARR